jgi:hypothetical protein
MASRHSLEGGNYRPRSDPAQWLQSRWISALTEPRARCAAPSFLGDRRRFAVEREPDRPAKDGRKGQRPKSTSETLLADEIASAIPTLNLRNYRQPRHGSASRFRH